MNDTVTAFIRHRTGSWRLEYLDNEIAYRDPKYEVLKIETAYGKRALSFDEEAVEERRIRRVKQIKKKNYQAKKAKKIEQEKREYQAEQIRIIVEESRKIQEALEKIDPKGDWMTRYNINVWKRLDPDYWVASSNYSVRGAFATGDTEREALERISKVLGINIWDHPET